MSVSKVLLHLGLPKTATSSLQHNVLQKLHEDRRINFLGKCLDYDYKTAKLEIFNYSGQFIRDAAEEKLPIEDARKQLETVLERDLLNVFSDEGLMVAYPGKENLPLKRKFENLRKIFKGYDVQIVVTLRDPVDYLYSLYVQLYPDFCSRVQELNSIEKYVERLLSDPDNVLFQSFFYSHWLSNLQNEFEVTVFQYEDLSHKNPQAYKKWADVLKIDGEEFKKLFERKRVNEKNKKRNEVGKVRDLKIVEDTFKVLLSRNVLLFSFFKRLYNSVGVRGVFRYRFSWGGSHRYPNRLVCERLKRLLSE